MYTSTKIKPYVYWLTHKESGQFYIGYREANQLPSDQDLPIYQSSSKKIKNLGFENFNWKIIAEFFDGDSAYDFEQSLIEENLNSSLILNQYVHKVNFSRWKRSGPMSKEAARKSADSRRGRKASESTREKQSIARLGMKFSDEHKANMRASAKNRPPVSDETRAKQSITRKGKPLGPQSAEHKANISKSRTGKFLSEETKLKISAKSKLRKASSDTKAKMSTAKLGKIGINDNKVNIMISKAQLKSYLALGWSLGRKSSTDSVTNKN